jgi:hypothetical protein
MSGAVYSQVMVQDSLIDSITADSTLSHQNDRYNAGNLIKNDNSSWAEGEDDFGKGVKISIRFKQTVTIKEFYIKNGYGDYRYYKDNNRVRMLLVGRDNYGAMTTVLDDNPGYQKISFSAPVTVRTLFLTIVGVYEGDRFNDTCLTHITFKEWNEIEHDQNNVSVYNHYKNRIFDTISAYLTDNHGYDVSRRYFSGEDILDIALHDYLSKRNILPREDGSLIFVLQLAVRIFSGFNDDKSSLVLFYELNSNEFAMNQNILPQLYEYEIGLEQIADDTDRRLFRRTLESIRNARETNAPIENHVLAFSSRGPSLHIGSGHDYDMRVEYIIDFHAKSERLISPGSR